MRRFQSLKVLMRIGLLLTLIYLSFGCCHIHRNLIRSAHQDGASGFYFYDRPACADPDMAKNNVIRLSSIPLISLAERPVSAKGVVAAYQVAQTYHLDIIHTQTEFGVGILELCRTTAQNSCHSYLAHQV